MEEEPATKENTVYTTKGVMEITKLQLTNMNRLINQLHLAEPAIQIRFHRKVRVYTYDQLELFIKARLLYNSGIDFSTITELLHSKNPAMSEVISMADVLRRTGSNGSSH